MKTCYESLKGYYEEYKEDCKQMNVTEQDANEMFTDDTTTSLAELVVKNLDPVKFMDKLTDAINRIL